MEVTSLYACSKTLQTNGSYKTVFSWCCYQVLRGFISPLPTSYGDDIYKKNICIY